MSQWKGIIIYYEYLIDATVKYVESSHEHGIIEWEGQGYANKPWPHSGKNLQTNIGTIKVLNQILIGGNRVNIIFQGKGEPKGQLANTIKYA